MRRKIVGSIFAACSTVAFAAPYGLMFDLSSEKRVSFYDVESVTKKNGKVLVWVKEIRKNVEDLGIKSTMSRISVDCPNRTMQTLSVNFYGLDRKLLHSASTPLKIADVVPGTKGAALLKIFCSPSFPSKTKDIGMAEDPYIGAESYFEVLDENARSNM